jgi:proline dehydrogenase
MIPPIASNFVAGTTPATALEHAREVNDGGVAVILNLLGEHYHDRDPADEDADAYVSLAEDIAESDVDACISVKPSQIGLGVSDAAFRENLARIVDAAECFVWIDMEDHQTTDVTLDAFEHHATETDGDVGVCIQANLKRTRVDLERLAPLPGKVRLVKGAYDEPKEISYTDKARVDESYRDLLEYAFEQFDDGVAVGSHDPAMLAYAQELHDEHGTPYEVQMLMGVREDAQRDLAADGVDVYQYVPYGSKWMQYFYRRIRERKENLLFAARAIIS